LNATTAIQLNGTSINTGGTLTNVAYKDQANVFSNASGQTFTNGIALSNGTVSTHGIMLPSAVPAVTTTNLYNNAGALTWGTSLLPTQSNAFVSGQIPYATGTNTIGSGTGLTFDGTVLEAAQGFGLTFATNNAADGPYFLGRRWRGTSGSPSVVQSGDFLFGIFGEGHDGTGSQIAAAVQILSDGTPGTNDMPGRLSFWTTPDGSATPVERMRIDNAGTFTLYKSDGVTAGLEFDGTTLYRITDLQVDTSTTQTAYVGYGFTGGTQAGNNATGHTIFGSKSRGTVFSPSIVASGDVALSIMGQAWDGVAALVSSRIDFTVDGTPDADDMPGRIGFFTTPAGSATPVERMRIDSTGFVDIPGTFRAGDTTNFIDWDGNYFYIYDGNAGSGFYTGYFDTEVAANDYGPRHQFYRYRGTLPSKSIVQNADSLGATYYHGYGGLNSHTAAAIEVFVDGTPGASDMPGRIGFFTTPDGSENLVERMRIDSTGTFTLYKSDGVTAALTFDGTYLELFEDENFGLFAGAGAVGPEVYSNTTAYEGTFDLYRARGTRSSPAIVQSGDPLGSLRWLGYGTSDWHQAASIRVEVDGTPGASDMPGRILFFTTPDDSATPVERMRIDNAGLATFTNTVRSNVGFNVNGTAGLTRVCNATASSVTFVGGLLTDCTAADPNDPSPLDPIWEELSALRAEVARLSQLLEAQSAGRISPPLTKDTP
jgi:hypothetical protein